MRTITLATEPAAPTFGRVKVGDVVTLHTRDGRKAQFVIQEIDGDTIVAPNGVRYMRGDIERLQRRSFSGLKTALLVGGLTVGAIIVLLAAAVGSLAGNIG